MALVESSMLPLGTPLPQFRLPATTGEYVSHRSSSDKQGFLVMFICNHCPYVKHLQKALVEFAEDYIPQGLGIVAINSNDPTQVPEDSFEEMGQVAYREGYPFPYLFDETQEVAREFQATCTPDFFLFDHDDLLVYRGQFDDSRPGSNIPITGTSLRQAVDAVLAGRKVDPLEQRPSMGCSIKWGQGSGKRAEGLGLRAKQDLLDTFFKLRI